MADRIIAARRTGPAVAARRAGARAALVLVTLASALVTCGREPAAPREGPPGRARPVTIFAAASLQTALDAAVPTLERLAATTVRVSYAGTPALARQIEAGAPADVFVSADPDWMQYLAARGAVRPGSPVVLLRNRLVLVAPAARPVRLAIGNRFPLREALGSGRLAVADPTSVPAGRYARAALSTLGVWTDVESRLAPAENVRAALVLVAHGEAPLGIVYETDARAEPAVVVVGRFPPATHPPIVYVAALTRASDHPAAPRVFAALQSPAAGEVFAAHGFLAGDRRPAGE